MKISIVTICLNNEKNLKQTIESVLSQNYENIEYIVIDGGSSDGTLEILDLFSTSIDVLVSETDNGIYSAMNKGISRASGEIVGILNSGDVYYDNKVLTNIADCFHNTKAELIYGHSLVFDRTKSRVVRKNISPAYNENLMKRGWFPSHQSIFCKTSVFKKCGFYNESYKIASDYEFLLRVINVYKIEPFRLNLFIIKFYLGGVSSKNLRNIYLSNLECYSAWKDNNLKMPMYTIPLKILRKTFQNLLQLISFEKS